MHTSNIRRALNILLILTCLWGSAPARAFAQSEQNSEFKPYWVVLERDTELRCGDSPSWYTVADLKKGQLLKVNGESFDWYRVEYPKGTRVWIVAREARIIENGARIETTRAVQPRAINASTPTTESSYRRVSLDSIIEPGTKFRYIGPINNNSGQTDGYIIPAPPGSSGFVIAAATRRATETEVRAFLAKRDGEAEQPDGNQPEQTKPETEQPAKDPVTEPVSQPEQPESQTPRPQQADPEADPVTPANADDQGPGAMEMGSDESAVENAEQTEALSPLEVVVQRSKQLDEAYAAVASQEIVDAEIQPLIDEFNQLIKLAAETELAADVRRYAQARIEMLNIRLELQTAMQELEDIRSATDEVAEDFDALDEMLAGRRDYVVVGRLVPSAIYNGKRLPLMYRLQSVDGGSGRTLAYVTPNKEIAIDSMLNSIVGVAGKSRPRSNHGVRIIEPTVIDVLRPGN
ncbi:MAG: hypothetical protein ACIAQF_04945 [Phycisphaerales bacterium JB065]